MHQNIMMTLIQKTTATYEFRVTKYAMMSCDPTYLLLNVLCHTCRVFGETFRIDHAIEGIRCDSECQSDILTVAQHSNIHNNVIFWKKNKQLHLGCLAQPSDCDAYWCYMWCVCFLTLISFNDKLTFQIHLEWWFKSHNIG